MKKIFMMAVMAVAALSANAQVWIGGEVGFTSSHTNTNVAGFGVCDKAKEFVLQPEVGYSLNDKFDVAIKLGYAYASEKELSKAGKEYDNVNTWTINPYVRYKFVKAGNFFAFVDGGIAYATAHAQGVKKNANTFGVNITPGIAYSVSNKVTLVSHLGEGLYYNHTWKGTDEGKEVGFHQNNVGFRLFNGITFGAYVNL